MKKIMLSFFTFSIMLFLISCRENSDSNDDNINALSISNLNVMVSDLPSDQYMSLTFINENTGIAVSNHGKIIKTTDAGKTWQIKNDFGTDMLISKVQFTDNNNGFAIAGDSNGGYLLKSVDGGNNWAKNDFNPFLLGVPNDMFFLNKNVGFIVGPDLFLKTIDGGSTWSNAMQNTNFNFNSINFKSSTEGYITCNNGTYFKTTNGGNTWQISTLSSSFTLKEIYFAGTKTFFNSSMGLLDLSNTLQTITLPSGANNLLFVSETKCIAVGEHYETGYWPYGDVLITNDLWKTNEKKTFNPSQAYTFKCIAKMNNNKAMMIGYGSNAFTAVITW